MDLKHHPTEQGSDNDGDEMVMVMVMMMMMMKVWHSWSELTGRSPLGKHAGECLKYRLILLTQTIKHQKKPTHL
eukprot:385443-Pelagomonas_calceolata.AAC.10